ncbi:hypothetical protein Kfla_0768 [Kribbella flavida DSM 17836]|uniref:Uncharacterized protein n=1 Tax=Kribbella flavida (strain DSM 17836 / JCM 10339 / NBRC 14399) TaxID=479435 RepID=D2PYP1_KRIFD|nr:hypothetical protein [Kribbella flavida]ADB29887.1 hypothetical protein Kfla_0768 [Kribbella flavida DSM 17836]
MLQARTLAEARLYLDLMAADVGEWALDVQLVERAESWSVIGDLGFQRLEVSVPFGRAAAHRFGAGRSELVDAAQWWLVATTSAERIRHGDLADDGRARPDRDVVAETWDLAVEAVHQSLEFLPEGADRLPPSAFWSETGERLRQEHPEAFTRGRLTGDQARYLAARNKFSAGQPSCDAR